MPEESLDAARALEQVITDLGPQAASRPAQVRALLSDALAQDASAARAQIDALVLATEEGIPDTLSERSLTDPADRTDEDLVERLQSRGLDDAASRYAVAAWAAALHVTSSVTSPDLTESATDPIGGPAAAGVAAVAAGPGGCVIPGGLDATELPADGLALGGPVPLPAESNDSTPDPPAPTSTEAVPESERKRRRLLLVGAAAGVAVLAITASTFALTRDNASSERTSAVKASTTKSASPSTSASPSPSESPSTSPSPEASPSAEAAPAPDAAAPAAPAPGGGGAAPAAPAPAAPAPAAPAPAAPAPAAPPPPQPDNCPGGDYTGNQYDGACGEAPYVNALYTTTSFTPSAWDGGQCVDYYVAHAQSWCSWDFTPRVSTNTGGWRIADASVNSGTVSFSGTKLKYWPPFPYSNFSPTITWQAVGADGTVSDYQSAVITVGCAQAYANYCSW